MTLLVMGVLAFTRTGQAQESVLVSSELDQYLRLLELDGKATGMPLVFRSPWLTPRLTTLVVDSGQVWRSRYAFQPRTETTNRFTFAPLAPHATVTFNSGHARTGNDGALWAGR